MKKKRTKRQKIETRETILRVGFLSAAVLTVLFAMEGGQIFGSTAEYVSGNSTVRTESSLAQAASTNNTGLDPDTDFDGLEKCKDPAESAVVNINEKGLKVTCIKRSNPQNSPFGCSVIPGRDDGARYGVVYYDTVDIDKTVQSDGQQVDLSALIEVKQQVVRKQEDPLCRDKEEAQSEYDSAVGIAKNLQFIGTEEQLSEVMRAHVGTKTWTGTSGATPLPSARPDAGINDAFDGASGSGASTGDTTTPAPTDPGFWSSVTDIFGGSQQTPTSDTSELSATDLGGFGSVTSDQPKVDATSLDSPLSTFFPETLKNADISGTDSMDIRNDRLTGTEGSDTLTGNESLASQLKIWQAQDSNQVVSPTVSGTQQQQTPSTNPTGILGRVQSTLSGLTKGLTSGNFGGLQKLLGGLFGNSGGQQSSNNSQTSDKKEEPKGSTTDTAKKVGGVEPGDPTLTCPSVKVDRGEQISLGWDCPNGSGSSGFRFSTDGEISGIKTISADHDEYGLFCNGEAKVCQIDINDPELTLGVQPDELETEGPVDLTWITSGVIDGSCSLTADALEDFSEDVDDRGTLESPTLASTTTFLLSCTSLGDNPVYATTTVNFE